MFSYTSLKTVTKAIPQPINSRKVNAELLARQSRIDNAQAKLNRASGMFIAYKNGDSINTVADKFGVSVKAARAILIGIGAYRVQTIDKTVPVKEFSFRRGLRDLAKAGTISDSMCDALVSLPLYKAKNVLAEIVPEQADNISACRNW